MLSVDLAARFLVETKRKERSWRVGLEKGPSAMKTYRQGQETRQTEDEVVNYELDRYTLIIYKPILPVGSRYSACHYFDPLALGIRLDSLARSSTTLEMQ